MLVEVLGGADGTLPAADEDGVLGVSYWALTRTGRKKAAKVMENFMIASKRSPKAERSHEVGCLRESERVWPVLQLPL